MATLAKLFVELKLKNDDLVKGLDASGSKLETMAGSFKKTGTMMTAGVTVPVVAAGTALFKLGNEADGAFDLIATKTGATGDALEALKSTTMDVFESIPTSMETAATAVADLSRLTGQSGDGLTELSKTVIELSRVTGEDLNGIVESSAQLFNNWNIAAEDQVATLDKLLFASQQTGVPVQKLSDDLTKYGPILREMGFGIDESTALLATLNKQGLDVGTTMAGLKKAFVGFAEAGITDTNAALQGVFDQIKNAPDAMSAAQIAIETFGTKAGPALSESIRSGNLEFQDLLGMMDDGVPTILDTAESTNDAAENFQLMQNKVKAAALPLATTLFQALNDLMPLFATLIGYLASGIQWFTNLPAPIQKVIGVIVLIVAALGPVLMVIGTLMPLITGLSALLPILAAAFALLLSPIGLIVIAVVALFVAWQTNLFGIRDITGQVFEAIAGYIQQLINWFSGDGFGQILGFIGEYGAKLIEFAETAIVFYLTLPLKIAEILVEVGILIADWVADVVDNISGLGDDILSGLGSGIDLLFNFGVDVIQGLVNGILSMVDDIESAMKAIFDAGFDKVKGLFGISSPSKVFAEIGVDVVRGFNIGAQNEPVNTMIPERAMPTVPGFNGGAGAATAGAGAGITLILSEGAIQVNGAGDVDAVGDAVLRRILNAADRVQMAEGVG